MHILRTARSFGDVLIVGVNTDDSVVRLKGSSRPVNDLHSRIAVLSEMRSVDFIVPFDEDTPLKLIEEIEPDILVKGGDYSAESIAGADFVTSNGGRIEIVPLLEGFSSTAVIDILTSIAE